MRILGRKISVFFASERNRAITIERAFDVVIDVLAAAMERLSAVETLRLRLGEYRGTGTTLFNQNLNLP